MTFEKHLRSISGAVYQSLGIFLERRYRGFLSRPILEYCSVVWCSAADTHQLLDRVVSGVCFINCKCVCTLFMVLYLCRMCQCGLHVVLWPHIDILMRLIATGPGSNARLLFPSQRLCGMILLTMYSLVWDRRL